MAMTLAQLRALLDAEGLEYFLHPENPAVLLRIQGIFGRYAVAVHLELEGTFLQFRSVAYLSCPKDHRNLGAVLQVLGELDYRRRLVKFGWDPTDGEIVVYADAWLEDGVMTQAQLSRICSIYFPVMDFAYGRLKQTLETGKDPGEPDETQPVRAPSLPERLRKLLERLRGRKAAPEPGVDEL